MPRQSKLEVIKDELISEYLLGISSVELGKKYNVTYQTILMFLRKKKILIRDISHANQKYKLHENFFDIIDSQEKAYFLGILYADGCNSTELNMIRLILTSSDVELLKQLSAFIYQVERPLTFRKGKSFFDKQTSKIYQRKDSYCLTIQNKHISSKLVEYGLIKAKSLKVKFPTCIQHNLLRHFIRGYFDGDGSVGVTLENQIAISILGTEDFTAKLQEILKSEYIKSSICCAKKRSKLKQLVIHGNKSGMKFLEFIYRDSRINLERKYLRFKSIQDETL